MALTIKTVTKTSFGNIKGNVDCYTGGNVDEILTDLASQIDGKLSSAMHYKGAVADMTALEAVETKETGDVYNVTATGKNYAWDGTTWDELSGVMDLSAYKTDTENEAKYLQIANTDTKVTELGYLKEAGVNTLITTALADYTKTEDLGDLASKDTVAYADLEATLAAKLDAKAEASDLTTLAGRVTTAEGDIDTAEGDIDTLEGKMTGIGNVTKATKETVTLYEVYDMVAAVIDAAKGSAS